MLKPSSLIRRDRSRIVLAISIIEEAERSGELKPGQTVVEATSGNTGVGLAMVCAARGYPFVATMPTSVSIERRKLMRFFGAKVILTPKADKAMGCYLKRSSWPRPMAGFWPVNLRLMPMRRFMQIHDSS